jgi:hypothetical protein
MVHRITPSLGPDLEQFDTDPFYDVTGVTSPLLGAAVLGSDGHKYVWVITGGSAIPTAGTDVVVNETTWVATAGAGTYETVMAAIPANSYCWVRQIAL